MNVLAIETSCDDTAAAVFSDGMVRSSIVASQDLVHRDYGGIVPELASRTHLRSIVPVIEHALGSAGTSLEDIEGIAVTRGPGLIGSLLVGLSVAKAIALARNLPLVGINHLEGHLVSAQLEHRVDFPYLALLVSGGHTSLVLAEEWGKYRTLGATRDDAAGEAFDKVARILALPYPGGRYIDELAKKGDPQAIRFPRARLKPGRRQRHKFDFSFSGLKTAVWLHVREHGVEPECLPDIAASFQEAITDMLIDTTFAAARETRVGCVVLAGGVSANSRVRARFEEVARELGCRIVVPSPRYCTDNAAMIALAGYRRLAAGQRDDLDLAAVAVLDLD